jgi:hypothetical protein
MTRSSDLMETPGSLVGSHGILVVSMTAHFPASALTGSDANIEALLHLA